MKVQMPDSGVPIVISYRKYSRKPKMKRERRYIGLMGTVKNLLVKAIELIEVAAFETKTEVEDPGQFVVANWAVSVGDPFNDNSNAEMKSLVAFRLGEEIPTSGVHFEIITPAPKKSTGPDHVDRPQYGPGFDSVDLSPEDFTRIRRQQEQQQAPQQAPQVEDQPAQRVNGGSSFRRPQDSAYDPRAIRTIEEEEVAETPNEEPENLDGASRLGEDD